eukprot:634518-Pleurochrysis_carterae.AAC.1
MQPKIASASAKSIGRTPRNRVGAFIGNGLCRDAFGMNSWAASAHCVSSVDDCRQRCVLNPDCACFAVQPELLQTGQCGKRQLRRCAIYRGASEARRVTSNAAEYDAFALTPR